MIYKPEVIAQILSTQAAYIGRKYGQMFYYTDIGQIWYDTQFNGRIAATDIYILRTERERNNFIPNSNNSLDYTYVYVVETNSLYRYDFNSKTWTILYGKYGNTTVAQTYLPNGDMVIVSADDVTTNGILGDGSVIVRDSNKMICGQLQSDGYTFNIRSLIGNQLNIDPSGTFSGDGCFQLNSDEPSYLNNDIIIFGKLNLTNKENWSKQYRLITQDITITSHTVIKKGSTLLLGSIIDGNKYNSNTKLESDIVTENNGLIITGSKIYIDSIINNETLKPPYKFDTDDMILTNIGLTQTMFIEDNLWGIQKSDDGGESSIIFSIDCPFINFGDTIILNVKNKNLNNCNIITFNNEQFIVDYITKEGISNTMKIVYYPEGKVKFLA